MLRITPFLDEAQIARPFRLDHSRFNPISTVALAAIGIFASIILFPFPLDILASAFVISLCIYNLLPRTHTNVAAQYQEQEPPSYSATPISSVVVLPSSPQPVPVVFVQGPAPQPMPVVVATPGAPRAVIGRPTQGEGERMPVRDAQSQGMPTQSAPRLSLPPVPSRADSLAHQRAVEQARIAISTGATRAQEPRPTNGSDRHQVTR
ncbi:MAG: hypothetical protein HZB76_03855 [Chlamydiae bacterium]|nr:hypothetical protein [Chlamydiota bacterium]